MPTEDGRPGVIAAGAEFEPVKYDPPLRCKSKKKKSSGNTEAVS